MLGRWGQELSVSEFPIRKAASSQLVVNKGFVLRHLARGHGREVLGTTLMADELDRDKRAMLSSLAELNDGANASSGAGGTASSGGQARTFLRRPAAETILARDTPHASDPLNSVASRFTLKHTPRKTQDIRWRHEIHSFTVGR